MTKDLLWPSLPQKAFHLTSDDRRTYKFFSFREDTQDPKNLGNENKREAHQVCRAEACKHQRRNPSDDHTRQCRQEPRGMRVGRGWAGFIICTHFLSPSEPSDAEFWDSDKGNRRLSLGMAKCSQYSCSSGNTVQGSLNTLHDVMCSERLTLLGHTKTAMRRLGGVIYLPS